MRRGYPTHRPEVPNAPRRIYIAFGEHLAAGVCVCVCSSSGLVVRVFVCVNVYLGVCSLVWLFADSRLSLFPWLVGCLGLWSMYACVFFGTCGLFSCFVSTFEDFVCFSCHFATLAKQFCRFFVLGGTLVLNFLILGLRLGALGSMLVYFYGSGPRHLTSFSTFLEKVRKWSKKGRKKGAEMYLFSMAFRACPENAKGLSTAPTRAD